MSRNIKTTLKITYLIRINLVFYLIKLAHLGKLYMKDENTLNKQ